MSNKNYKWVVGSRMATAIDAQTVGEELERIQKKYGAISKEAVVAEAKAKNHPFHSVFEWDDAKAGEAFRLQQAGYLIRNISVVYENPQGEEEIGTRAFVLVKPDETSQPVYTPIEVAMENVEMREQVFKKALFEINRWKSQYKNLTIFAEIFASIDKINIVAEKELSGFRNQMRNIFAKLKQ